MGRTPPSAAEPLTVFRALPGDMTPRDAQDLMAYPFFSLAKSRRIAPIRFEAGSVRILVEGVAEHGIATIWDADVLIWAASQLVAARDLGLHAAARRARICRDRGVLRRLAGQGAAEAADRRARRRTRGRAHEAWRATELALGLGIGLGLGAGTRRIVGLRGRAPRGAPAG